MVGGLKQLTEVLVLRSVPGLINLAAMLSLAMWLSTGSYGLASTYIATSGALANLLFGHVIYSALAMHAEHAAQGQRAKFEGHLVSSALVFAVVVGGAGLGLALAGVPAWPVVVATAAFGAYAAIQEILHARVSFIRFAIASTSQSLAFLILVLSIVRADPRIETALLAFAVSYALGAIVSAALAGVRPGALNAGIFRASLKVGTPVTLSTLAADSFALGCRYLLILFGALQPLGIFSFSLDIAQKLIGIFINAATFAIVPRAFRDAHGTTLADFRRTLRRGALVAAGVALSSLAALLLVGALGLVPAFNQPIYDPLSLVLVALAVIANRSGKLVVSPVALRVKRSSVVLASFAIAAPVGLAAAAAGIAARMPYAVEMAYVLTFGLWLALGHLMLSRHLQRTNFE